MDSNCKANPSIYNLHFRFDVAGKKRIRCKLATTAPDDLSYMLRQATGRIFENLNFEYFHLSVAEKFEREVAIKMTGVDISSEKSLTVTAVTMILRQGN